MLHRAFAISVATFVVASIVEAQASAPSDSRLQITPANAPASVPRKIIYRPPAGMFGNADSLVLRARMRTARDAAYDYSLPAKQIRDVAVLRRAADGSYEGRFTLPAEYVFASLAVADVGAERIDSNFGRAWEILAHTVDGIPTYEALEQRAQDMLGRSWEEGFATARRMTELYPYSIAAWGKREFFETAIYTSAADSIRRANAARFDALLVRLKQSHSAMEDDLDAAFFRVRTQANRSKLAIDSAEAQYWWDRLQREFPRSVQIAQFTGMTLAGEWSARQDRTVLDSFEVQWKRLAPLRGPGRNLGNAAMSVARQAGDDAAYLRWVARSVIGMSDSAQRMAFAMAALPTTRPAGLQALRTLLAGGADTVGSRWEYLTESAAGYRRRVRATRGPMLMAIGRALVADGEITAGLDTLTLASHGVWDVALFTDIAGALNAAGNTVGATRMNAKIAVDPRTRTLIADSLSAVGRLRVGAETWDSLTAAARHEMFARELETAMVRTLPTMPQLADGSGASRSLRDLLGAGPSVVIFWSRQCAEAVSALPAIVSATARLEAAGTPVVFVVDEAPSGELTSFLSRRGWRRPVYYDIGGSMALTFSNFGTPTYYVFDADERIRFTHNRAADLPAQASALRSRGS